MAQTNAERIGRALEILGTALSPYVIEQCERALGPHWRYTVANDMRQERAADDLDDPRDVSVLLRIMWDQYNQVFKASLGYPPRGWVSELREARNAWAHLKPFSTNDAQRTLDTIERLLRAIGAIAEADEIETQVRELSRMRYEESARKEVRRATTRPLEWAATGGLRPWRDIVSPHDDVASGRFVLAEYTADLWQVAFGSSTEEYGNPAAFFQRTYLTQGLHDLLHNALLRLSGNGGEPVMELQTNFGGGKTHAMLALFHLFSGASASSLVGVEGLLHDIGLPQTFTARRAVLSGQKIAPGQPSKKADGTIVHTLWGELAWQLGGYDLVAEADRTGTNPGDNLRLVLERAQPCLILIDEWVAHARQLYYKSDLPAGSFDANMSFAQALSESVAHVPRALLVVSLPASDTEVAGDGGREALARLKQVFHRIQSPWRPATDEEGYEIVRRRLFQPIDETNVVYRDAVIRAFSELYQSRKDDFPTECKEDEYRRRMAAAYPFHPELFDRLYKDWSQLDSFQMTRGVLRLLAKVVRALWDRDERSLIIMPAGIPIDDDDVQNIINIFLDARWRPIIETDVIGLARTIDDGDARLKKIHAARRVARTVFMGSAPVTERSKLGLTIKQITLGSVQLNEEIGVLSDALRRLADRANYLYSDNDRNWYSTQPSVMRMAQDRAAQLGTDDNSTQVYDEIRKRLRAAVSKPSSRGHFMSVHVCPTTSGDVEDKREARLVILGPSLPFVAQGESAALRTAMEINEHCGTTPRYKKNMLVYLAPDGSSLAGLKDVVCQYLAWQSILKDAEVERLNLDAYQKRQADGRLNEADKAIETRLKATYIWLLYPKQPLGTIDPTKIEWLGERLPGQDEIAQRASKYLVAQQDLTIKWASTHLRRTLDDIPLWPDDHISIDQLAEYFARYLYLDRLQSPQVLLDTIRDGLASKREEWVEDGFAYADSYDTTHMRYRGLRIPGEPGQVLLDGLLVKPTVALAQRSHEAASAVTVPSAPPSYPDGIDAQPGQTINEPPLSGNGSFPSYMPNGETEEARRPHRFHGNIDLNILRPGRRVSEITEAIIDQLEKLPGAHITVTLEIEGDFPEGVPENIVQAVQENARGLHIHPESYGFEDS